MGTVWIFTRTAPANQEKISLAVGYLKALVSKPSGNATRLSQSGWLTLSASQWRSPVTGMRSSWVVCAVLLNDSHEDIYLWNTRHSLQVLYELIPTWFTFLWLNVSSYNYCDYIFILTTLLEKDVTLFWTFLKLDILMFFAYNEHCFQDVSCIYFWCIHHFIDMYAHTPIFCVILQQNV